MEGTYRFKLVLFGNVSVGKTSLIDRFVNDKFESDYTSTLGYNVFEKSLTVDEINISFIIFDIGGQEQFAELRKKYATGAKAALLVYDITNKDSFNNIENWHTDLMEFTDKASFILVGNKVDLSDERQVEKEEGMDLSDKLKADGFFETSAKNSIDVDSAFLKLAEILVEKAKTKKK